MGLYSRGDWYHYRIQIEGKVYTRALKLKKGQERLLNARLKHIEEEIRAAHFGLPFTHHFKPIRFNDFKDIYLAEKKHKKSVKLDAGRLSLASEFWKNPFLDQITRAKIIELEDHLLNKRPPCKTATVNRYMELLSHFFSLAIENGYSKANPLKGYEYFVEDRIREGLSKDELHKILSAAKKLQDSARSIVFSLIYDLIAIGFLTNMRLSQVLNLKKSYIHGDWILYPITETKYRRRSQLRSQKVNKIYLNKSAREIIGRQKSKSEFVFELGSRRSGIVRRAIYKVRETSGVDQFTFHQLRHTVGTTLSSSESLATAKVALGHSDLKTTLQYIHPDEKEMKRAMTKVDTIFKRAL